MIAAAAHRADLFWVKAGPAEYMRADGVTIRKTAGGTAWAIFLPSGLPAQEPSHTMEGVFNPWPAVAPSLQWAKLYAEQISADSPAHRPEV